MKQFFFTILVSVSLHVNAQMDTPGLPPLDKSPMDMSYFPPNYPALKIQNKITGLPVMRVIYSRPQLKGRKIFGGLQEYGKVWRLGANEATEIEFFKDVKINNKKILKGRYTLYAIPQPDKWTFIINKENDTWGSFGYDQSKDVMRIDEPVIKNDPTEIMTIVFDKSANGAIINVYWEDVKSSLPVEF